MIMHEVIANITRQSSLVKRHRMRRIAAPRNCTLTSNQFEMCAYAGHTSTACNWGMLQLHGKQQWEEISPLPPGCEKELTPRNSPSNT